MTLKSLALGVMLGMTAVPCLHAQTGTAGFGWEICQTGTDPHGLYEWDYFLGPFTKTTSLTGIQITLSQAPVPNWLGPNENGFNETLLTVMLTGGWSAPNYVVQPQQDQGQYVAGNIPGAIARMIIKDDVVKHAGAVNEPIYIPLNGIVIPAGQAVKFAIAHIGPNSDVELQGVLQYQQ